MKAVCLSTVVRAQVVSKSPRGLSEGLGRGFRLPNMRACMLQPGSLLVLHRPRIFRAIFLATKQILAMDWYLRCMTFQNGGACVGVILQLLGLARRRCQSGLVYRCLCSCADLSRRCLPLFAQWARLVRQCLGRGSLPGLNPDSYRTLG